jgi:hypothetical protein
MAKSSQVVGTWHEIRVTAGAEPFMGVLFCQLRVGFAKLRVPDAGLAACEPTGPSAATMRRTVGTTARTLRIALDLNWISTFLQPS